MSEIPVTIPVQNFSLQALYEAGRQNSPEVAVLCHPHPLYGGNMHNIVVARLQQAWQRSGRATLRFNFRGVGGSGGQYADGIGEVADVAAVVSHLAGQGKNRCHLAGYSFGAWVLLRALQTGLVPASLILVAPPLDLLDFSGLRLPAEPCLITVGDKDPFCSIPSLRQWLSASGTAPTEPDVVIFSGCDHFYGGYEDELSAQISAFVQRSFPAGVSEKNRERDG